MIIPGIHVMPPPHNATVRISPHNFGYLTSSLWLSNKKPERQVFDLTMCRESLHASRNFIYSSWYTLEALLQHVPDERPFYCASTIPIKLLSFVFDYLENKIGVKTKAQFQETDEPEMVAIFPGRFWGGVAARFGLFTCLLRGMCYAIEGEDYENKSWSDLIDKWFDKAMKNYGYLANTKKAVMSFLDGNTFILPIDVTADWWSWFSQTNSSCLLLNPLKFSHEEYEKRIRVYADFLWKRHRQVVGKDLDLWLIAERYAAVNSCR